MVITSSIGFTLQGLSRPRLMSQPGPLTLGGGCGCRSYFIGRCIVATHTCHLGHDAARRMSFQVHQHLQTLPN
jgi:hypothetical protein